MEVRDYWRLIRLNKVFVIIVCFVATGLAALACLIIPVRYSATSRIYVSTTAASSLQELNQGGTYAEQIVKSYASLATTPFVLEPVAQKLGNNLTASQLASTVSAESSADEVLVNITASDTSATRAAHIADAVADRLSNVAGELSPTTGTSGSPITVTRVQSAIYAVEQTQPRWALIIALGLVGGFVTAIVVLTARELLSVRFKDPSELSELTSAPLLGSISRQRQYRDEPLIDFAVATDSRSEEFRKLRTSLKFGLMGASSFSLLVSSAIESEGKSTVAANLALAFVASGARVVLIDADMRRPTVSTRFGVEGSIGLSDVLINELNLTDAMQSWGDGSTMLQLLPAGSPPPNPSELLESNTFSEIIRELSSTAIVIIDAPPVLPVTDSLVISEKVSGVLLVAAVARPHRKQVAVAADLLRNAHCRIVGTAATLVRRSSTSSGYNYSYGYGQDVVRPRPAALVSARAATEQGAS